MGDNPVMLVDPAGMRAMLFPGRPSYQVNVMADMLSRMPTMQSQYDMASHFSNYSSPGMSMLTGSIREAELMNIVQTWLANALPGTEKLVNKRGETVFSYYTNHGEVTFERAFNSPIFVPVSQINVVLNRVVIRTARSDAGQGEQLQANGGSERSGLDNANIIVGAISFAQGAQENIIALDKSLNNLKYTKGLKVVGKALYVAQVGIAGYNTYSAWSNSDGNWRTNDGNKWGVTGKAALDLTIGAVAVWGGPVGWVVGGVYFIGDAAGWWGDWGKPTEP